MIGFERMIPTEAELRTSLNRWDRGIFGAWSQDDPEATFPVVQWEKYESKICHDEVCHFLRIFDNM